MSGKGHAPRPFDVPREVYESNHARIFGERKKKESQVAPPEAAPAQDDANARDAARYRWLRDRHDAGNEQWFVYGAHGELDDSIDVAIASSRAQRTDKSSEQE